MALFTYILLLIFLNHTLAGKCAIDNTPEYVTWLKELMNDLECWNSHFRAPSENTVVNISYLMSQFSFDSKGEKMTTQSEFSANWNDERLKWDPEKHHGIDKVDASNMFIWSPMFELLDSENSLEVYYSLYRYELKHTGHVLGRHRMHEQTQCHVKLTDWPYDVQECSFEYAHRTSSRYSGNYSVNFSFMVMDYQTAGWFIYDFKQEKNDSTSNQVKVTFFLVREAVGLSAILICPAFVLFVLNILSLCLDVRCNVRLAIICFSLLGHYYFLRELAVNLPKESNFPPILLLYYRDSLVLSVIILMSSLFLATVCMFRSTPPDVVKRTNGFVYENKYTAYLVYPRWGSDDNAVDRKLSREDWVKFANILNSVLIFVVVIAYIGLYGSKIPKQTIHYNIEDYFTVNL